MKRKIYRYFKIINSVIFIILILLMVVSIGEAIIIPENVDIFTCSIVLISGLPVLIINRVINVIIKRILRDKDIPVGLERVKKKDSNE